MKNWRLLVKLSVYVTVRFVAWKGGSNNRITVQTKRPRVPTIKVCKEKTRFDCWGTVWCPLTFPIIADGRTTQTDNFQKRYKKEGNRLITLSPWIQAITRLMSRQSDRLTSSFLRLSWNTLVPKCTDNWYRMSAEGKGGGGVHQVRACQCVKARAACVRVCTPGCVITQLSVWVVQ